MQNLYRVVSGDDLVKLLTQHKDIITVVFFSDDRVPDCKSSKPLLVKASKTFKDCMFVFLDLKTYDDQTAGFISQLNGPLPKYMFYYDKERIALVDGPYFDKFIETLNYLLTKLHDIRVQQTNNDGVQSPQTPHTPSSNTNTNTNSNPNTPIPTPISKEQYESLQKIHAVQKKKMIMELSQLNLLKTQQQKMLLGQIQIIERIKKEKNNNY